METSEFFSHLWKDYVEMTPQAEVIADALKARNETIVNDHVAFRTFNLGPVRLEKLEPFILQMGYTRFEPYHFAAKKLDAVGYVPPNDQLPRIFISELRVEELTEGSQKIIRELVAQVSDSDIADESIFWRGPLWQTPSYEDYLHLLNESEYAAWLSVIGLRANHFTISINALNNIREVSEMNEFIEDLGFTINSSGGRVKGTPAVLLEQSSTMASSQEFDFPGNQTHQITTCYYEFAKRYYDDRGELYQGFVAASADKIFESTNVGS